MTTRSRATSCCAVASWLDRETVVFSVDAPSDQWAGFSGAFRASERYAEDIRELVGVIRQQYGLMPLAVVGTSEGSVSAYYAARAVPRPDTKVIFTNSVFLSSSNVPGLSELDFERYGLPCCGCTTPPIPAA